TAVAGLVTFTNLSHNVATNITILFTSGSLTSATSSLIAVSAAGANKLAIQTQPSATATAGVAFAQQPVIRVEDQFGNLMSSDNSTVVTASRSAGSGTLQGTLSLTAVNGVASFANLSHIVATNITIQFTSGSLASATSSNVTVSPAAANRLTIQTQPPSTATAGAAFAPQPQVRIEDQFGNLRMSDNSTLVSAVRNLGSGPLQGATSATASRGVASFSNLSYPVSETMNIGFSSGSLTNATSANVVVSPALFAKLQLLVPGESAAPGTASGKSGVPAPQSVFTGFTVTVNAVDANWNRVNTVTDLVGITASDSTATLPANAALASGTQSFLVSFNTNG